MTAPSSAGPEVGPGATGPEKGTESTKEPAQVCASDKDCTNPEAPACDPQSNRCIRCTRSNDHCLDSAKPYCTTVEGVASCQACVADRDCQSSGRGSFCLQNKEDGQPVFRCVDCVEHKDCSDPQKARCDLRGGTYSCMPCDSVEGQCGGGNSCLMMEDGKGRCTQAVIYVAERSDCENGEGTLASPFCGLSDALKVIEANVPTTVRMPGGDPTKLGLVLKDNVMISIVGNERFNPQLKSGAGNEISIHGLSLHSGVILRGESKLRLSAVAMGSSVSFEGRESSQIWVDRSSLAAKLGLIGAPLFSLENASLKMSSSVIAGQQIGSDDPNRDKLALFRLNSGSKAELDHMTIVQNDLRSAAPLFRCLDKNSKVTLDSSIVLDFGKSSEIRCTGSQLRATRVLSDLARLSKDQGASWEASEWKGYFRDPDNHDYGLKGGQGSSSDATWKQIRSLGHWNKDQRPWDLDGEPWKKGPGFVGADQAEI